MYARLRDDFELPSITYQAGNIFGKAVNAPDHLATTVVSFMICSLFGGKKFLYKVLHVPVYRLNSICQYLHALDVRGIGGY